MMSNKELTPESLMSALFGDTNTSSTTAPERPNIKEISLDKLFDYPHHNFKTPEGESWESFVESIRQHGVLQPIIVRQHPVEEGCYQIIAGHCRTKASRELGLKTIPVIEIDVKDDVEASVLVGLTNKQREYISDLEWGLTYRETYELMKRQGERTDLTSSHGETKLNGKRTDELLAEKYGESRASIQRKIRLTYLIGELVEQYEAKNIKQAIAVNLSYLTEAEQRCVLNISLANKMAITEEIAKALKEASKEAASKGLELTTQDIFTIMVSEKPRQENVLPKPKSVKYAVPEMYFPAALKKKEKEEYILKALQYVQDNGIVL